MSVLWSVRSWVGGVAMGAELGRRCRRWKGGDDSTEGLWRISMFDLGG